MSCPRTVSMVPKILVCDGHTPLAAAAYDDCAPPKVASVIAPSRATNRVGRNMFTSKTPYRSKFAVYETTTLLQWFHFMHERKRATRGFLALLPSHIDDSR